MKRALLLIKDTPHYRREAFESGLKACGFTLVKRLDDPKPGDVLCTWNLTGMDRLAWLFNQRGAKVIVTENAYLTPPGVPGMYAISLGGHCGAGTFPAGGPERWEALGITPKPWRERGDYILVCGQRSIGSKEMASPHGWHQHIAEKLQRVTRRPIRVRPHPGQTGRGRPLAEDLAGAHAVIIWSSACGVHALVEGIPTYFAAPHWICSRAATRLSQATDIEQQQVDDQARMQDLHRMAWGQWHHEEISTGEPLRRVLECSSHAP